MAMSTTLINPMVYYTINSRYSFKICAMVWRKELHFMKTYLCLGKKMLKLQFFRFKKYFHEFICCRCFPGSQVSFNYNLSNQVRRLTGWKLFLNASFLCSILDNLCGKFNIITKRRSVPCCQVHQKCNKCVSDQRFKRDFWKKKLTHKTKEEFIKRITTLISFGTLTFIQTKCRIESRVKLFQSQFLSYCQYFGSSVHTLELITLKLHIRS